MPVDAVPNDSGNIALIQADDPREAPRAVMISGTERPPNGERYVSHFASCPNADDHRTKK